MSDPDMSVGSPFDRAHEAEMEAQEHRERLEAMVEDNGQTWDLSDNDKAAIRWVLDAAERGAEEWQEDRAWTWDHEVFASPEACADAWGLSPGDIFSLYEYVTRHRVGPEHEWRVKDDGSLEEIPPPPGDAP